jgi:hypothetical protein
MHIRLQSTIPGHDDDDEEDVQFALKHHSKGDTDKDEYT